MPLPLDHVADIVKSANVILQEDTNELATGANNRRPSEIYKEIKLVQLICKAALLPYVDVLRPYVGDEILKTLGLI